MRTMTITLTIAETEEEVSDAELKLGLEARLDAFYTPSGEEILPTSVEVWNDEGV